MKLLFSKRKSALLCSVVARKGSVACKVCDSHSSTPAPWSLFISWSAPYLYKIQWTLSLKEWCRLLCFSFNLGFRFLALPYFLLFSYQIFRKKWGKHWILVGKLRWTAKESTQNLSLIKKWDWLTLTQWLHFIYLLSLYVCFVDLFYFSRAQ